MGFCSRRSKKGAGSGPRGADHDGSRLLHAERARLREEAEQNQDEHRFAPGTLHPDFTQELPGKLLLPTRPKPTCRVVSRPTDRDVDPIVRGILTIIGDRSVETLGNVVPAFQRDAGRGEPFKLIRVGIVEHDERL